MQAIHFPGITSVPRSKQIVIRPSSSDHQCNLVGTCSSVPFRLQDLHCSALLSVEGWARSECDLSPGAMLVLQTSSSPFLIQGRLRTRFPVQDSV